MRTWIPTLVLVMRESATGEDVPIGSTTDSDLIEAVSDRLMEEADRIAERARVEDGDGGTLATLFQLDRDKLQKTIQALISEPPPAAPRLVPVPEREAET